MAGSPLQYRPRTHVIMENAEPGLRCVTVGSRSWRPAPVVLASPSRVQTRRKHKKNARRHFFVRKVLLCLLVIETFQIAVKAAVWTNGPEDNYFCGYNWDDEDCRSRQHCPSGMSTECEFQDLGMKCFANTQCDTRYGHGDWFVSGKAPNQAPGGKGGSGGGSSRPTYTGKSDNPVDHYWCGVGLADANSKCEVPCPGGVSSECPQGNACYHDVYDCDARNLPPPTPTPTSSPPTESPVLKGKAIVKDLFSITLTDTAIRQTRRQNIQRICQLNPHLLWAPARTLPITGFGK